MRRHLSLLLVLGLVLGLVLAGCSAGQVPELDTSADPGDSSTPTVSLAPGVSIEPLIAPEQLTGLEQLGITIEDGETTYVLTVAVADTDTTRINGLKGVADLGDLDGMLFVFSDDTDQTFWMEDVLLPLDIAFFDSNGALIGRTSMQTCESDCPSYGAEGNYRYAIEVPDGTFSSMSAEARLVLGS